MSYHRSESAARKWLLKYTDFVFKLGNAEPADFLLYLNKLKHFVVFADGTRREVPNILHPDIIKVVLVEVKSVRSNVWYLRSTKRQLKQHEALKAYSERTGIPTFYLVSLVKKHKRVWRFVPLETVAKEGKVTA